MMPIGRSRLVWLATTAITQVRRLSSRNDQSDRDGAEATVLIEVAGSGKDVEPAVAWLRAGHYVRDDGGDVVAAPAREC